MVEQGGHDVADLTAGFGGVIKGVQPLLDVHGPDFLKSLRSPVGLDVPLQVAPSRLDGSEGLTFRDEFVLSMVGYEIGDRFGTRCSELMLRLNPKMAAPQVLQMYGR